jgi:transposase
VIGRATPAPGLSRRRCVDGAAHIGPTIPQRILDGASPCAGLDVGATAHVVAVAPDRDPTPVRAFRTFSGDLHQLADWLHGVGVTTVAMESTGVYWIPVFEILEARGFDVILVNARHAKQVPGRKTDVNDAQWLQQLHQYGLLRGSFRPREVLVRLRAYLRHRERRRINDGSATRPSS